MPKKNPTDFELGLEEFRALYLGPEAKQCWFCKNNHVSDRCANCLRHYLRQGDKRTWEYMEPFSDVDLMKV